MCSQEACGPEFQIAKVWWMLKVDQSVDEGSTWRYRTVAYVHTERKYVYSGVTVPSSKSWERHSTSINFKKSKEMDSDWF